MLRQPMGTPERRTTLSIVTYRLAIDGLFDYFTRQFTSVVRKTRTAIGLSYYSVILYSMEVYKIMAIR